jgi:hypothetical protein
LSRHNRERRKAPPSSRRSTTGTYQIELPQHVGPVVLETPPEIYAEAVHRAVCEFSGSDGFGQCSLYAVAGFGLMVLTKLPLGSCYPQVGSLYLQPDPTDPTF